MGINTKQKPLVVFFGSGPVAATSLAAISDMFDVELVVTKPVPENYHGTPPVIELAQSKSLALQYAKNATELSNLFTHNSVLSSVGIVVDFGVIIPQSVIDFFAHGIVNSHFSLLPQWRGADPISFSILSGQETTGVSLMLINARLDEGDLLLQQDLKESPRTLTASQLTDKLVALSNSMLKNALPAYLNGTLTPYPQTAKGLSYSRKLTKQDSQLDWHKPAVQLEREIRAYQSWPKSRTYLGEIEIIVTKAHATDQKGPVGTILAADKTLVVYCAEGALAIDALRPAGKPTMNTESFLAGYGSRL